MDCADGVAVLRLNRPQALNAFTAELLATLRETLERLGADESVRAVVITGEGRAFCAGQDLSDPHVAPVPGEAPKDIGYLIEHFYAPMARALRACRVPTVCAVNGVAAGAGLSLALGCDLVVASEKASFVLGFNKIGLVPDAGSTWLLPRLVGRARAMELALLGDKLSAADALAWGLINRCVAPDALLEEAKALAARLAVLPTRALVRTRQLLDEAQTLSFGEALKAEGVAQSELGFAHDYREGVEAFMQKRAPRYTDR